MPKPPLFDTAGRHLRLGQELGRGGEGAVYEVQNRPDAAIKLYQKPLDSEKSAKIAAMAKLGNERLIKLTAWPVESIRVGAVTGPVAGFIMPKITGHKQAFSLYSPKLRPQEFPRANWQFLIRSAANAARAFSVVHESGHVIGDVKHDNLLVGAQATVRLVDCDSYQITWNGSRWFCEVGTPTHQPPELQNIRTYRGIVRNPNHDNFGLAVIIFQMLFMARHPFSGRFLGTGEMPMERAISEYRFVYGSNAAAIQMEHPPASLGLDGVTRDLALLFERAFSRQGSQPNGRPRPDEWVTALQDLEKHLRTCGVNSAHQFTDILNSCPWCEIEAVTGAPLFQVPVMGSAQVGLTIAALWAKVNSVPNPGPSPPLPSVGGLTITLSPGALELQRVGFGGKLAAGLLSLVGAPSRLHSLKKEIDAKAVDARSRWQNLQNNWENYTSSKEFQDRLADLQDLRSQYDALPQKRLHELKKLESNRYRLQLHAYLDGCRIAHARIKGVGVAKKAMLQSYGIETAAEIIDHRVLAVPGFGPVLLSTLTQWRDQQQRRFVFDPNKGVDQITKNAVERQILTEKVDLERKLHEGLSKLSFSSNQILTRRRAVLAQAEQAVRDHAQAEADLQVSSGVSAPGKRAIAGLAAISVVGLIVASQLSKGPPAIAPQLIELQTVPTHQPEPAAASRIRPVQPTLPPHVEKDRSGQLRPEDGYDWSDGNHASVRWVPRKISRVYPHVIASDTEGEWQPDDGYDWANSKDKSARWLPGISSTRYPRIVAAGTEGQWRPADGYTWVISPPRPGDMRVMPARTVDDLRAAINTNTTPWGTGEKRDRTPQGQSDMLNPEPLFQAGLADRADWEQWIAGLSGEFRRGAEWWASHRSLVHPVSCDGPVATSPDFEMGCEAAKARLTPTDLKRKSNPEYRRGWNNYNGAISPAPAPDLQASPVEETPQASEPASADRLNAQELNQLKSQ